jgi:hypothetical protein
MKDIYTDFYYIIDHPVSVREKYTTGDNPLKSYFLEVQFNRRQTSKIGNFIGEFKIENELFTEILPIENKIFINIIDSFVDDDFCCIDDPEIIFPTETPRPTVTPTPSPPPAIECDDSLVVSGGKGYYVIDANIGRETGKVSLELDSYNVPDRFMIFYSGNVVADSSFVGDGLQTNPTLYRNEILTTTTLTKFLWNGNQFISSNNQSVSFTEDDITNCNQNRGQANTEGNQNGVETDYPNSTVSNCEGRVKISFIKETALPETMQIVVIGCNNGTAWNLSRLICPQPIILPSLTPTISITPSITPTISVTPSITPTISVTPSITPTISVTPSITPTISVTPSITPSVTPTISVTPSITPTISVTPSITPTISLTPSVTISPNPTPTIGDKTIFVHYDNI